MPSQTALACPDRPASSFAEWYHPGKKQIPIVLPDHSWTPSRLPSCQGFSWEYRPFLRAGKTDAVFCPPLKMLRR